MITLRVNKPLPIAQRPKCPQCRQPLRPYWATIAEERSGHPDGWKLTVEWKGRYHGYGHFCTLRCTERFANAIIDRRGA